MGSRSNPETLRFRKQELHFKTQGHKQSLFLVLGVWQGEIITGRIWEMKWIFKRNGEKKRRKRIFTQTWRKIIDLKSADERLCIKSTVVTNLPSKLVQENFTIQGIQKKGWNSLKGYFYVANAGYNPSYNQLLQSTGEGIAKTRTQTGVRETHRR